MCLFILRRLLQAIPILILASVLTFILVTAAGDPLAYLRERPNAEVAARRLARLGALRTSTLKDVVLPFWVDCQPFPISHSSPSSIIHTGLKRAKPTGPRAISCIIGTPSFGPRSRSSSPSAPFSRH